MVHEELNNLRTICATCVIIISFSYFMIVFLKVIINFVISFIINFSVSMKISGKIIKIHLYIIIVCHSTLFVTA